MKKLLIGGLISAVLLGGGVVTFAKDGNNLSSKDEMVTIDVDKYDLDEEDDKDEEDDDDDLYEVEDKLEDELDSLYGDDWDDVLEKKYGDDWEEALYNKYGDLWQDKIKEELNNI